MSDIVERLRRAFDGESIPDKNIALRKAADEIERLRAENAAARQAADDVYFRLMPEVERLRADIGAMEQKVRDADSLLVLHDLQWDADARAIKRWQEAHPEKCNVWPDRADMVVWLMDQHATAAAQNAALREALIGVINIADRDCPEFRAARAALATGGDE